MKMTKEQYAAYVDQKTPNSPIWRDLILSFVIGGLICCLGQGFIQLGRGFGLSPSTASTVASVALIFLGALCTGLGFYDDLAKIGGAGTLVPITGFANAVVAPALEFKSEGMITGLAAKIFVIAGPVIVYGVSASIIYGLILCLFT